MLDALDNPLSELTAYMIGTRLGHGAYSEVCERGDAGRAGLSCLVFHPSPPHPQVYAATHVATNTPVAIKRVFGDGGRRRGPDPAPSPGAREAAALERVRHPNVVKLLERVDLVSERDLGGADRETCG